MKKAGASMFNTSEVSSSNKVSFDWNSIRTRLLGAFGAIVLLSMISATVSYVAFNSSSTALLFISGEKVPLLAKAVDLSTLGGQLNENMSKLTNAKTVSESVSAFEKLTPVKSNLDILSAEISEAESVDTEKVSQIAEIVSKLESQISDTNNLVTQRIEKAEKRIQNLGIASENRDTLVDLVEERLDVVDDPAAIESLIRVNMRAHQVLNIYATTAGETSAARIEVLRTEFSDASDALNINIVILGNDVTEEIRQTAASLSEFGTSDQNFFDSRISELRVLEGAQTSANVASQTSSALNQAIGDYVSAKRVQVDEETNATNSTLTTSSTVVIFLSLATLVFSAAIIYFYVSQNMLKRLSQLVSSTRALADGKLDVEIPTNGADELSSMAGALQVFKENGLEMESMRSQQAQAAEKAEAERRHILDRLANEFETNVGSVVKNLVASATEMKTTAVELTDAASDASTQSGVASTGSEQAAASVQATASATTELTASIGEIAHQVQESASIAQAALEEASSANQIVNSLNAAATRINEVVTLISDITGQTNLLALNATIEAARAGEAGKGFAVVANEVKGLSAQTEKATGDIASQIQEMQSVTKQTVDVITGISDTIHRINEIASAVSAAVQQQNAVTNEIAQSATNAATATESVSQSVSVVGESAARSGSAADQVLSASQNLSEQSDILRQQAESFVKQLRAA